ncbi:MAG: DUF3306 domain-containing protein [Limnobacter sp.]|uniref:DUF3306 domain-containing protein n=1 Tax=Limnobacter sp. TaxID=2003368 RepID=UPI0032EEF0C1
MSENFLSRWSKRKLEVREREHLAENLPQPEDALAKAEQVQVQALADVDGASPRPVETDLPVPTEDDLAGVEQGGDIKAFLVDKVSKDLKNKAFKALFSRPEFNVMDGLDIYIDDYNKFTPLSKEDIEKMTFSKQLLSRPDLELLKTGEISDENNSLLAKALESEENQESESEQSELQVEPDVASEENHENARVIPDESQAIDSEQISTERSFEKSPLKQR